MPLLTPVTTNTLFVSLPINIEAFIFDDLRAVGLASPGPLVYISMSFSLAGYVTDVVSTLLLESTKTATRCSIQRSRKDDQADHLDVVRYR